MSKDGLAESYRKTRSVTVEICDPLEVEDFVVQPADFVSPPKWHMGHTTWFFEQFVLLPFRDSYQVYDPSFDKIFNSYYKSVGDHWRRDRRGHLSRPTQKAILSYRAAVDEAVLQLIDLQHFPPEIYKRIELGLNHEQQHQELLLMDIKYILSRSPIPIAYRPANDPGTMQSKRLQYVRFDPGLTEFGDNALDGFCFDNETPKHKAFLYPYHLANRPITNGEYLDFIADGGYRNPLLWRSDGWDFIQKSQDKSPLYWSNLDGQWQEFTLNGLVPLDLYSPVSHLTFYEADAFAAWAGARLPTEFELEFAYRNASVESSGFLEAGHLRPHVFSQGQEFYSLTGNLWEWTTSAYSQYPNYKRPGGALGEYNQKFMVNQIVLRGGSFATPKIHFRNSYRNFFYPIQGWAFTGLRLAKDVA